MYEFTITNLDFANQLFNVSNLNGSQLKENRLNSLLLQVSLLKVVYIAQVV
jgi:hypothetical protein